MQASMVSDDIPQVSNVEEQRALWREYYKAYQERYTDFQRLQADFQYSLQYWQEQQRVFGDLHNYLKREAEAIRWRRFSRGFPV